MCMSQGGGTIKRTSRRIIQCAWYVEVQYEREIEREGEIRTEVGCTSVSNLTKNKRKDRDNQDFKTKTKPRMRE